MGGDSLRIAMAFFLFIIVFLATNLVTLPRIFRLYKAHTTTGNITTTRKLACEEAEGEAAAAAARMCRLEKKANMSRPFDANGKVGGVATPPPPPVHQNRSDLTPAACNGATAATFLSPDAVINLDHGDPTMFEAFWKKAGDMATVVIPGWKALSYFSSAPGSVCWFLEPDFADEVRRLHRLVGNAAADGKHIVVGTGSTQLFQAALYALCPSGAPKPTAVVSSVPYYSSYPLVTDYLQSRLYYWAGDAMSYNGDGPYVELVCSPNNPDGFPKRAAVARSDNGKTVHDLAYYWPQYTAITAAADHDIMLFTVSKSTGHAGTRIGWALVKDEEVARKMTKFIELNTIGVSKDSQLRAAKILSVIADSHEHPSAKNVEPFFQYGRRAMVERWARLRAAVKETGFFSLPDFSADYCNFSKQMTEPHPAFAWMRCEKDGIEDCHSLLKSHKILTRGGTHFGGESKYVRVSMLDRDPSFDLFIERLLSIH